MHPLDQIKEAIIHLKSAPAFIQEHKLWHGYWEASWTAKVSIVLGALITLLFISNIGSGINQLISPDPNVDGMSLATMTDTLFLDGGVKYILLILLEMLIFHFSVKTIDVLKGTKTETSASEFMNAQIRMIKVSLRSYILEIILGTILGIFLGGIFELFSLFLLQAYFIGFAFMDNYYEQYNIKIRESAKYIREHAVAAIVIGIVGYVLFAMPLVGALLGPFICAVAATTYLFYQSSHVGDEAVTNSTIAIA